MVIDASAIVAIAFNEPEAKSFHERIADDPVRLILAATVLETAMVIETRLGEAGGAEFDLHLQAGTDRRSHLRGSTIPSVRTEPCHCRHRLLELDLNCRRRGAPAIHRRGRPGRNARPHLAGRLEPHRLLGRFPMGTGGQDGDRAWPHDAQTFPFRSTLALSAEQWLR